MLSIPLLATSVLGACLGATVTFLGIRAHGLMPTALATDLLREARSELAEARVDRDLAHRDAREARAAMIVCAQKLNDEQRAHEVTKQRADALEMGLGEAA